MNMLFFVVYIPLVTRLPFSRRHTTCELDRQTCFFAPVPHCDQTTSAYILT